MAIKLDINDLKNKNNDKKDRMLDLDDLQYREAYDAVLERYKNKGKKTLADIVEEQMALQQLDDMRWERKQRMKAETQSANPQMDVDEIIRKAQEPLLKQIEEMKRAQEKAEEEKRWENMQRQIDRLTELIVSGGKKNDDESPILKQLNALQEELRNEKEKARKKEQEDFQKSLQDMVYGLSDQINELKAKPEKSQSEVEQIINLEKKKREILDALGVKPEKGKDDDANLLDGIDAVMDRAPKIAKTVSTVREIFNKDAEIPDDVPDDVPTNLPQRNEAVPKYNPVPEDIKEFLDRGKVENGTYVDYTGTPWVNLEGKPISRKDIEDLAITNPDDVRRLMRETDEAYKKKMESKEKAPKVQEKPETDEAPEIHTPPKIEKPEAEEEVETDEPDEPKNNNALQEAMDYINTGRDVDDPENGKVWVGQKNEFYTNDDGKPATTEDLKAMAQENPEGFMHDVREHLKSLENGE